MTATRRTSVLGLAVLLAAASAAADTVITIDEVLACSVESANANFVRLKLPQGGIGMLYTRDVYEIRLSNPDRVAAMAAVLPLTRVTADSGQATPSPEARYRAVVDGWAEAKRAGSIAHPSTIDALPDDASPALMVARCREMRSALLAYGRSGDDIAQLLRDVYREERKVRGIWTSEVASCTGCAAGDLAGGSLGEAIGRAIDPPSRDSILVFPGDPISCYLPTYDCGGGPVGCAIGCTAGILVGVIAGRVLRDIFVASRRAAVNDLVRRVNRAVN